MVLITCNGYKVLREIAFDADAPEECRVEEERRNDGYAVCAWQDGRIVADAEGWAHETNENAAYEAGYAYACGYVD